jgi:PHD/YefM family antitoxin component YafN of YafNO toxin-antitoxin module
MNEAMTRPVPFKHFAKAWERSSNKPVRIKRNEDARVLMSEEEYEGLVETIHLLSNPANAKDLLEGIKEADAGKFIEHELIE